VKKEKQNKINQKKEGQKINQIKDGQKKINQIRKDSDSSLKHGTIIKKP